jgi:flagellar basal-body rod protein FlgG
MKALQIAALGMIAQQRKTEVVANNLANMNTTGYQRRRTEFSDLVYSVMDRKASVSSKAGEVVSSGVRTGSGVRLGSVYRIHEQGSLNSTSNTFDLAIQGEGFFQVLLPNGETTYTRDGTFQLNAEGELVTHDGFAVQPGISIPVGVIDVVINSSGEVLIQEAGEDEASSVGAIQIANFPNKAGLEALGDNLFRESPASGPANIDNPGSLGLGTVLQGFVETSNVNPLTKSPP